MPGHVAPFRPPVAPARSTSPAARRHLSSAHVILRLGTLVADGSAAERFEDEFIDAYGLDGIGEETLQQVTRRTPGFHAWQDPHWLVHCNDAAAFIGEAGYTELAARPEALDQLRLDLQMSGWNDAFQLEDFLTHLGQGASAMLFRCTVCGCWRPSATRTGPGRRPLDVRSLPRRRRSR